MKKNIFYLIALLFVAPVTWAQNHGDEHEHHDHLLRANEWTYEQDDLPAEFHKSRREELRAKMPEGGVSVIFAGPVRNRSNDINFEYHQDPNFYYLTGYREPHAVLLILKEKVKWEGEWTNEIIFVQPRKESSEIWDGKRLGIKGAQEHLKIQTAIENYKFSTISTFFEKAKAIFYMPTHDDVRDNPRDKGDLYSLKAHFQKKMERFDGEVDENQLNEWLARLRQIKTPEEIKLMRKAIDITCIAQMQLMKELRPEMTEYQSEAIIEFNFKYNGAEYAGFPSILGSGENSCILHYNTNRKPILNNEMLVSDVGAEYHGYTADVTRTIPSDGKFSEEEKAIYEIVYEAQTAGIELCKPGAKFWDPHLVAQKIIAEGLMRLKIIKSPAELSKYFMHGTSHYLGLDVHDVGLYGPLEEGNVITVEPGIYIAEGSDCDPKWWNIGIRIEDDILITQDGYENLSDCVPRTWQEIEAVMKKPKE